MRHYIDHRMDSQAHSNTAFATALFMSVMLHGWILYVVPVQKDIGSAKSPIISLIKLKSERIDANDPQQIVSLPKEDDSQVSNTAKFLSDENRFTKREQIKRGMPSKVTNPSPAIPSTKASKISKAVSKGTEGADRIAKKNKQPSLKLEDTSVLASLSDKGHLKPTKNDKTATKTTTLKSNAQLMARYQPFSHGNSANYLSGDGGQPDFLPNIPDGDITFLNTKAHRHAVFVRRVATQVFAALKQTSERNLAPRDLRNISSFATVDAMLSPTGELISVTLTDSSGSRAFNDSLLKAAKRGARDQNPPSDVVALDGNIHFIFKARTWSRFSPDSLHEQRWILLATGLL